MSNMPASPDADMANWLMARSGQLNRTRNTLQKTEDLIGQEKPSLWGCERGAHLVSRF